jgi:hypothetical protein
MFFPFRLRFIFDTEDLLLVMAVFTGFIGQIFAPEYGSRTLNHSLAIVSCVFIYYFFTKASILPNLQWATLINTIAVMTFLSACFLIAEFSMANFLGIQMRDIVPYIEIRLSDLAYSESTMMGQWIRPRGVSN